MEEREPKLGVAVGRKGCGKTYQTYRMMQQYVVGNPAKVVGYINKDGSKMKKLDNYYISNEGQKFHIID